MYMGSTNIGPVMRAGRFIDPGRITARRFEARERRYQRRHGLGLGVIPSIDPVSTAINVALLALPFLTKKKQPGTDYQAAFDQLQPGEYITGTNPTPGASSITKQPSTPPPAPQASLPPGTPLTVPMQPQTAPVYVQMPSLPNTAPAPDYTTPLLIGGAALLAIVLLRK